MLGKIFAIVVDNAIGHTYFNSIKQSWLDVNLFPIIHNASTPESIADRTELTFNQYSLAAKYVIGNIKKPFTPTEKAVWYSHYDLWNKAIELNETITIIEHDALLLRPEYLVNSAELTFYDKASMGAYSISPRVAKWLVGYFSTHTIVAGPMGEIQWVEKQENPSHISAKYAGDDWAVKQLYDPTIGTTIDHYSVLNEKERLYYQHKAITNPDLYHGLARDFFPVK